MKAVRVAASGEYDVIIGGGLLADAGRYIADVVSCRKAALVSDDTVFSLYGDALQKSLALSGIEPITFVFPHGERSKSLSVYGTLLGAMCDGELSGSDAVIALGGGVAGDLAGFAAATYRRGTAFIQIPTTLLAAVDSSVGGKTGINLDRGKNQAGAFYQPSLVLCDTDTLKTLPEREYKNGCAEIIKYAMIGGYGLFEELFDLPAHVQYEDVIAKCVAIKRDIVEKDERDTGIRRLLNFGHTVGHAIEVCSRYTVPHGEAVAVGMAVITSAAVRFGICSADVERALYEALGKYSLPRKTAFSAEELAAAAMSDKKIRGDSLTLIVPEDVGRCVMTDIPKVELAEWLRAGGLK